MNASSQDPQKHTLQRIESEVPFGHTLSTRLCLNSQNLENLIRHDQIEQHYLAWESVRKHLNPFFQQGTGFEGYFVGRCANPEAALDAILSINQHMLDAIARLYRFQFNFRSRLMKTLTRETYDPEATHIWSACLGAELGKLRLQILRNPTAQQFRARTYGIVQNLPPMVYRDLHGDVIQTYAVSALDDGRGKVQVRLEALPPNQQDAWLVAQNIGEFGHPLVRKFLDQP